MYTVYTADAPHQRAPGKLLPAPLAAAVSFPSPRLLYDRLLMRQGQPWSVISQTSSALYYNPRLTFLFAYSVLVSMALRLANCCAADIFCCGGGLPLLQGWCGQDLARLGRRLRRRGWGHFLEIYVPCFSHRDVEHSKTSSRGNETCLVFSCRQSGTIFADLLLSSIGWAVFIAPPPPTTKGAFLVALTSQPGRWCGLSSYSWR